MKNKSFFSIVVPLLACVLLLSVGSRSSAHTGDASLAVPTQAEGVHPILVGQSLPKMVLKTPDGHAFDVNAAVAGKPTVLIFYRGGWCPFCNRHLAQLQGLQPQLKALGYQILAISPDRPAKLQEASQAKGLHYQLLSDSDMGAAKSLGIAFKVEEATVDLYKNQYNIDLEGDSGQTHHMLPVPSVFVAGTDGVIAFSYVNPNYKVRLSADVLMAAAKAGVEPTGSRRRRNR